MDLSNKSRWYADENRPRYLLLATVGVVVITAADWFIAPDIGLDFAFFLPVVLAAAFLSRWQIASFALVCTALRDLFIPAGPEKWPRLLFVFAAYFGVALVVRGLVVYNRSAREHLRQLEDEIKLRDQWDERLEGLLNSTPVGILTISPEGKVVFSNQAAHQVFGVAPGALSGQEIGSYLPDFQKLLEPRTVLAMPIRVEANGRKANGEGFPAHVWLYHRSGPSEVTLVVLDASQDLPAQTSSSGGYIIAETGK